MSMTIILAALLAAAPVANKNAAPAPEPPDGGMVQLNGKGKVAIVNACGAQAESLEKAAQRIGGMLMLKVECQKGVWSLAKAAEAFKATGASVAVFVVKDKALPMSLVALESKWGVVNAEGLDDAGLQKEVMRIATVVLGGASSKYPASSMRPVFCPEDLKKAGELITIDSLMAIFPNLESLGLRQYEMMTYRDACEAEMAPPPANEEQRKIAAEVKAQLAAEAAKEKAEQEKKSGKKSK